MTLTIELTPEEETRLQEEAQRTGVAPADYVHRLIEEDLAVLPENPTGAQIVEYLKQTGALGVYADRPAEFAQQLRARVWQGEGELGTQMARLPDVGVYGSAVQPHGIGSAPRAAGTSTSVASSQEIAHRGEVAGTSGQEIAHRPEEAGIRGRAEAVEESQTRENHK